MKPPDSQEFSKIWLATLINLLRVIWRQVTMLCSEVVVGCQAEERGGGAGLHGWTVAQATVRHRWWSVAGLINGTSHDIAFRNMQYA